MYTGREIPGNKYRLNCFFSVVVVPHCRPAHHYPPCTRHCRLLSRWSKGWLNAGTLIASVAMCITASVVSPTMANSPNAIQPRRTSAWHYNTHSQTIRSQLAESGGSEEEKPKAERGHARFRAAERPAKPGEPQWDSLVTGPSRLAHRCSTMARQELGDQYLTCTGGGQDLIFPHHENEIAQSEAFTGKAPFAQSTGGTLGLLNVVARTGRRRG